MSEINAVERVYVEVGLAEIVPFARALSDMIEQGAAISGATKTETIMRLMAGFGFMLAAEQVAIDTTKPTNEALPAVAFGYSKALDGYRAHATEETGADPGDIESQIRQAAAANDSLADAHPAPTSLN